MSAVLTPSTAPCETDEGWIVDGIELLPPPSPELVSSVLEICEEFREAFEEMKRLGD